MRKMIALAAISALALSTAAVGVAKPTSSAASINWLSRVVDTGTGWRVGNPKAPAALVEYGSFNCPHCAAFAEAALPSIREQVAAGKISFEFRPKQLFPHDPSATVLALCAGPAKALLFTDAYMASSGAILDRLRAAVQSDPAAYEKVSEGGTMAKAKWLADTGGMKAIAARAGVSTAKADQCLADPKLYARVEANEKAALAAGVTGTPTFFIDGQRVEMADLARLKIVVHAH